MYAAHYRYVTFIVIRAAGDSSSGEVAEVLSVLRIVRFTRIFRVLKASKALKMMMVLGRTLYRSITVLFLLFFLVSVMMLLFGAFVVTFEMGQYNPHTRTQSSAATNTAAQQALSHPTTHTLSLLHHTTPQAPTYHTRVRAHRCSR